MNEVRLGKKAPVHDKRTLRLRDYTVPEYTPPAFIDFSTTVASWPMLANDRLGDCTCAAAGHMVQLFSRLTGAEVDPTDEQVVELYNLVNGGVDEGAAELVVLNQWRRSGLAGIAPFAYASLDTTDTEEIRAGVSLFAGVYIGLALPASAQREHAAGDVWHDTTGQPNSWGGHAVSIVGYDTEGLTCITWGAPQRMTWGFWAAFCDEAYAVLPADWKGLQPTGFNFDQLQADLAEVGALVS